MSCKMSVNFERFVALIARKWPLFMMGAFLLDHFISIGTLQITLVLPGCHCFHCLSKYLKLIFLNWRWKIYFDHGMTMGRKIVVDDDREKESIWMGAICSATEQTTSSGSRQALPDISIFNHCHHHHLHLTTTVLIIITILLPRHGWQGGCAGRQVSHSSLSGGSHWTNMYFIFVIYLFWI